MRRLRDLYYRLLFGHRFPGSAALEERVRRWELRTSRGDVPKAQDDWDRQYAAGGWDFLDSIREVAHYSVIVGYAAYLRPGGSVLDVGCGAGVLYDRFRSTGPSRYVGIDISTVAISSLQSRARVGDEFVAADAEEFTTDETFDIVVFNESITYFSDPEAGFGKYRDRLAPGGHVIVSCHVQSARAQAILRRLTTAHPVVDDAVVQQGSTSWRVVVFGDAVARGSAPTS